MKQETVTELDKNFNLVQDNQTMLACIELDGIRYSHGSAFYVLELLEKIAVLSDKQRQELFAVYSILTTTRREIPVAVAKLRKEVLK